MAYITDQDFKDAFKEREYDRLIRNESGVPVPEKFTKANSDVTNLIDSALVGLYVIPLSSTPKLIRRMALNCTRYYLYDDHVPKDGTVERNYIEFEKLLLDLAEGTFKLIGVTMQEEPMSIKPISKVKVIAPAKKFSTDFFSGFP